MFAWRAPKGCSRLRVVSTTVAPSTVVCHAFSSRRNSRPLEPRPDHRAEAAVDGEIEHGEVADTPRELEPGAYGPYVLWLELGRVESRNLRVARKLRLGLSAQGRRSMPRTLLPKAAAPLGLRPCGGATITPAAMAS